MKKLQSIIFKWNYLFVFMLFFVVMSGLLFFFANTFVNFMGMSRVDLLEQVAERSKIINKAAITLANNIYINSSSLLLDNNDTKNAELSEHINRLVADCNYYFDGMDIDLSALVLMKNGFQYYSRNELTSDIKGIKSNYWYIDNFHNKKNEFWIMRFGDTLNKTNCMLSYGKIIRNSKGEYMGLILINSSERTFFKVYSDIVDEGNKVYILDENGYAISHSIKDLIGSQIFYMPAFFKQYGDKGFKLDYGKNLLISNYFDPATKWTLVQESDLNKVFGEYVTAAVVLVCILLFLLIVGFIISLAISKYIAKPLHLFAEKLYKISTASFEKISIQNTYEEVYTISIVYNEMVDKIENLISKIKEEEEIKRQHELDFLQLQINPHFLHNTLLSVKCLVELSQSERAAKMLTSFMHMLRQPIAIENELISLKKEIENLQNYTNLMGFRYENVRLSTYLEETTENCLIPRLLLQPIVENSIFHGLDEENSNLMIELFAFINEDKLIIKIRDNGVGITREELNRIWTANNKSNLTFNSIGLKNVRDRIKKIYGEGCGLEIISTKGEGTEVELILKKLFNEVENEKCFDCG